MKITFLGTGTSQGVPVIACDCPICQSVDFQDNRLRSSILIEVDNLNIVIDTGPDFRQQILRERVKKLDAILYTHAHKDHTAGLDDVRSFNFKQKKDMPIYGTIQVLDQIKSEFAYAFAENKYPGVPQIETNVITNTPFKIGDTLITPIEVMHHKLPVLGFRINDFVYITDANYISDEEKLKITGCEHFVINALQREEHISHFTFQQAIDLSGELKVKNAYFTHISHKLGKHREVSKELPDNIRIAYDGLKIEC